MKTVIIASDEQWNEWPAKVQAVEWIRVEEKSQFLVHEADIYIDLHDGSMLSASGNIVKINSWPGFLQREVWEVAGEVNDEIISFLQHAGKSVIVVSDEPGLVAARIIAMIINEAYFAFGDNVSTKEEIDTAMKLGTNYPFGPFQWADKIGIDKIHNLLTQLAKTDQRYQPAPALVSELNSK